MIIIYLFVYITPTFVSARILNRMKRAVNKTTESNSIVAYRNMLISVLSHETKGLFANIMWMINILETGVENHGIAKELLSELKMVANKNLSVLQNMVEWIKLQKDSYKPAITEVEVYLFYQDLHVFFVKQLEEKELKFLFQGDEQQAFLSDEILLGFVLRRIMENMIAFALPQNEIVLETVQNAEKTLVLRVKTKTTSSDLQEIFCTDVNALTGKNLYSVLAKDIINQMNGTIGAGFADNYLFIITITLPKVLCVSKKY